MSLPRIALTMGDVAGVGPEVIARSLFDERISQVCRPLVVGHPEVLRRALKLVGANDLVVTETSGPESSGEAGVDCWNPGSTDVSAVPGGAVDGRAGRAAYDYLIAAIDAALAGKIHGITTAPLSKAALALGGVYYPGHTEILAERCGVNESGMMLYVPPGEGVAGENGLAVAHVTLHTSLRSVLELVTTDAVREKIRLLWKFLQPLQTSAPRIAVTALNPHAGEEGLFGDEESRVIAPAVNREREFLGPTISGPFPADTLFRRSVAGEFDGVVAMYHDQGHIAMKLVAFDRAVNITLGLPIVRTSPSHGTAFDIAWRGTARADGMVGAILMAAKLAHTAK